MKTVNNQKSWTDLSAPLTNKMVHWPGEPEVSICKLFDMNKGGPANVTTLSMSAHTGTHIDAPLHYIKNGKDISSFPLDLMTGSARIIEIKHDRFIPIEEVKQHDINPDERVLFKTKNSCSDWAKQEFKRDYIYLSSEAANYLKEKKVSVVGVDYISIGGKDNGKIVHEILLGNEIWVIEGLYLNGIKPGLYEMICMPLKIKDSDGAPARVIVRKI
ncbi:cyclase [Sporocytophaga myxococcoides]|uniref:Kynurenine formamidase n=1 Tax=Sporocytophaga myxococcoides TaxID=153721 RepID=A0A098LIV0_9BACT|nr:cyclase family protein [Sporocytophaga myxococcoides]GAL86870.1 cyclase [Sporocytophaga myxococcoides]